MHIISKLTVYVIILAIMDIIIPVPFTALLLLYVLLEKPAWFYKLVDDVYQNDGSS